MIERAKKSDFYQLLYFSPRPEDGEQVCVAILAFVRGRWIVEFDEKFTKMKSIARGHDVEFARSIIEGLGAELKDSDLSSLVVNIGPQLRVSEPRELLVFWSEDLRKQLRKRFLRREKLLLSPLEQAFEESIQNKIGNFLSEITPKARGHLIAGVRPSQLFTEEIAHQFWSPKPITRAIVGRTRAVLIDGVDTSLRPSTEVIKKANKIAFTFWQYGRITMSAPHPGNALEKIVRVGIVFNGYPKAEVLREYSLHQFKKDADVAVEAHTGEGLQQVREEIQKTLEDIRL